jgi:hypothetical protein
LAELIIFFSHLGSYAVVKEGLEIHTEQRVAVKIVSKVSLKTVENGAIIVKREVSLLRYAILIKYLFKMVLKVTFL